MRPKGYLGPSMVRPPQPQGAFFESVFESRRQLW